MAVENPTILTKQKIDNMTYGGGWDVRWDAELTGLGLRVYPSGKKSFVVSYRTKGAARRKHLMVLGPYGVLTLKQARDMAKGVLAGVIQGNDPLTARRQAGRSSKMVEVLEAYIERYAKPHKK